MPFGDIKHHTHLTGTSVNAKLKNEKAQKDINAVTNRFLKWVMDGLNYALSSLLP